MRTCTPDSLSPNLQVSYHNLLRLQVRPGLPLQTHYASISLSTSHSSHSCSTLAVIDATLEVPCRLYSLFLLTGTLVLQIVTWLTHFMRAPAQTRPPLSGRLWPPLATYPFFLSSHPVLSTICVLCISAPLNRSSIRVGGCLVHASVPRDSTSAQSAIGTQELFVKDSVH